MDFPCSHEQTEVTNSATEIRCLKCHAVLATGQSLQFTPVATAQRNNRVIPVIDGDLKIADQVGGDHYARLSVQPFDLIKAMEPSGDAFVDYSRGCIIKYAARKKGDKAMMAQDLRKAAHYAEKAAERLESESK